MKAGVWLPISFHFGLSIFCEGRSEGGWGGECCRSDRCLYFKLSPIPASLRCVVLFFVYIVIVLLRSNFISGKAFIYCHLFFFIVFGYTCMKAYTRRRKPLTDEEDKNIYIDGFHKTGYFEK